jgi:hypothetical protein
MATFVVDQSKNITVADTVFTMRPDLINRVDCECPPEHSITKLGHNRDCPYTGQFNARPLDAERQFRRCASIAKARRERGESTGGTLYVCGRDTHIDGTPHDFEWATYSDETTSYGVCFCGLTSFDFDIMRLP